MKIFCIYFDTSGQNFFKLKQFQNVLNVKDLWNEDIYKYFSVYKEQQKLITLDRS